MSKASAKLRNCPATAQEITAEHCGEHRHSRYACPPACAFNPFADAAHSSFTDLAHRLQLKITDFLQQDRLISERFATAKRRVAGLATSRGPGVSLPEFLLAHSDSAGLNALDRWEKSGLGSLRNDERVFLRAYRSARLGLIEFRRARNDALVEVADLWRPDDPPFALAVAPNPNRHVTRFLTMLTWMVPLPHFHFLASESVAIPPFPPLAAPEVLRLMIQHMGGPEAPAEQANWVQTRFTELDRAFSAVIVCAQTRAYEVSQHEAELLDFAITESPEDIATFLSRQPGMALQCPIVPGLGASIQWHYGTTDGQPAGTAYLLVMPKHVQLNLTDPAQAETVQAQLLQLAAGRLTYTSRRSVAMLAPPERMPTPEELAAAPPALLAQVRPAALHPALPPYLAAALAPGEGLRLNLTSLLATPNELFGGLSPKEAAEKPDLRPGLREWVKREIARFDQAHSSATGNFDINDCARELGFPELIIEPSGERAPAPALAAAPTAAAQLPSPSEPIAAMPPPPIRRPLTPEDLALRLPILRQLFRSNTLDFPDCITPELQEIIGTIRSVMISTQLLPPAAARFVIHELLDMIAILLPPIRPYSTVTAAEVWMRHRQTYLRQREMLERGSTDLETILLHGCRQPALLRLCLTAALDLMKRAPMESGPLDGPARMEVLRWICTCLEIVDRLAQGDAVVEPHEHDVTPT